MHRLFRARFHQKLIGLLAGVTLACGGGGGGGITFPTACSSTQPTPNANGIAGTVCYQFVPATVSGALEFGHAVLKPVRNATVRVMQGSTVLASTITDENGQYSADFTAGSTGQLELWVLAETSTPVIRVVDNTSSQAIWGVSANIDASTHAKDLVATHGWAGSSYDASRRAAAPFAILDTMYTASHAFMAVRPTVDFPQLKVNWSPNNYPNPYGGANPASGNIGTSHFSPSENQIYILGKEGADTDEFDSHVIAHEWGHFFESNLSRSDSPGGGHTVGDILDPRLAFGEGYGSAIAAMVLGDPVYVDTMWDGTTLGVGVTFDAQTAPTPTDDPYPGAFSEMSILRILYDIFDSGSNESYDQVAVGLGTIYDVLIGPEKTTAALTTIGSFITGLKAQSGVVAADVDTLMDQYNIGAITDDWGAGDSGLEGIFTSVTPNSGTQYPFVFQAHDVWQRDYNKRYRNQYFWFQGNDSDVTVNTHCDQNVDADVYLQGVKVASAETDSGNETVQVTGTQSGKWYVVVVNGYADVSSYNGYVTITSP